jgi:hypothetical protein
VARLKSDQWRKSIIGLKVLVGAALLMLPGRSTSANTYYCHEFTPSCGGADWNCDSATSVWGVCEFHCTNPRVPDTGEHDCTKKDDDGGGGGPI